MLSVLNNFLASLLAECRPVKSPSLWNFEFFNVICPMASPTYFKSTMAVNLDINDVLDLRLRLSLLSFSFWVVYFVGQARFDRRQVEVTRPG